MSVFNTVFVDGGDDFLCSSFIGVPTEEQERKMQEVESSCPEVDRLITTCDESAAQSEPSWFSSIGSEDRQRTMSSAAVVKLLK